MISGGTMRACREVELPAKPTSLRRARGFVRSACRDWSLPADVCDDACLVVNELVANAVDHARTACVVTLDIEPGRLRIAVEDADPRHLPVVRGLDVTASRGRGLQMISSVSTAWGVRARAAGKAVWAHLSTRWPVAQPDRADLAGDSSRSRPCIP